MMDLHLVNNWFHCRDPKKFLHAGGDSLRFYTASFTLYGPTKVQSYVLYFGQPTQ
jgi:hypothetical protein